MSAKPSYNLNRLRPRERRLAQEHIQLYELCERSEHIDYKILRQSGKRPPDKYLIIYRVKSIVGIDADQMPIYGYEHKVSIELPPMYPASDGGLPSIFMQTKLWHPNVRWSGTKENYVCADGPSLGAWHKLDDLVVRVGEIIQYKNYLAENVLPYPEDEHVAKWVREFAEPKGIISKTKPVDTKELLSPLEGFSEREPLIKKIKIKKKIIKPVASEIERPVTPPKLEQKSAYDAGGGITIRIKKK